VAAAVFCVISMASDDVVKHIVQAMVAIYSKLAFARLALYHGLATKAGSG